MARNLKTGWVIIATSGNTIDGREIKKEWLNDMATHYNDKMYSAKIWPDHERYFGAQGKVLALKVEPAADPDLKDEVQLMAILAPSDDLVRANQRGNYTHTSIEVLKDFAKKGYFYLGGLAVTDDPASLGTTELQFSEQSDRIVFAGANVDLSSAQDDQSHFQKVNDLNNPPEQETEMNKEQFDAFTAEQQKTQAAIMSLVEIFSKRFAGKEGEQETPTNNGVTAEAFTALQAENKSLTEKFTALETQFNELKTTGLPGTKPGDADGGAQDECL